MPAPNVTVTVSDQSQFTETFQTVVPFILLATASNKATFDGTGIAAGTTESNVLRAVTSQKDVINLLSTPTFLESGGDPLHGNEANEYGAWTLWSLMGTSSLAYYIRADIDLGQLVPSDDEPTRGPVDGTYWVETDAVVGGFFRRNAGNTAWEAVPFSVKTVAPVDGTGTAGDICFDYATAAGTLKVKTDAGSNKWISMGSSLAVAIDGRTATTADLWISDAAPTGAAANDYWWKTSATSSGYDLKLKKYRASDATWVSVLPIRSLTQPSTLTAGTVWEDISTTTSDGAHPLKISNGTSYSALTFTLSASEPVRAPSNGTLWYCDDFTDFAMYREDTNDWVPIVTTSSSSPTASEKVISASAPTDPDTNAIWIDVSAENFDNFPVIKRYTGSSWEDITESVDISATYRAATVVTNGTYWINLDDPITKCTVKTYDDTYEPDVLDEDGLLISFAEETNGRWRPVAGATFLRKAQRTVIVAALKAALAQTASLKSESTIFQLMAAPGYPELFPDLVDVNTAIDERAHIVADVPFSMVPDGVTVGKEITVADWKTNARAGGATGEAGFASSTSPYASMFYPHGLGTNSDGATVFVPSSALGLRTLIYNDTQAAAWFAPMNNRGVVSNASAVGYLDNDNAFINLNLDPGEAGLLYDNNVNMFMNLYRVGLRNMGNKTTYGETSELQSLNVARLVSKMKFEIKQSMRAYLGQPNDPKTWGQVKNSVDRYLAGLVAGRALNDAAARCDEKTNTAERIARKELTVEVAIQPIGAVEFVFVPITIVGPGDTVS